MFLLEKRHRGFAAVHESASGTKRTFAAPQHFVRYWTRADIGPGREPFATLDGVYMAKYRMFFASTKAEQELGYRSRPYVEGIEDAVRWFLDAGYLGS
jgi:nucleoside-diphosphate-sugar epimerase